MNPSILWYDLETFGLDSQWDRIAQFAALRTNLDLQPIEEPIVLYCRLAPDYWPDPWSFLKTRCLMETIANNGLVEAAFIENIFKEFSRPNTCVAGFNNIRFDDELLRHTFYRNLYEPYARESKNGNTRWDLLDVVRATHDLRPEGIIWPKHDNGHPDFQLESLTKANQIPHENAHDGLNDVQATLALAKLIRAKQPRLFHYALENRAKENVKAFLEQEPQTPFLHTSGMFSTEKGCTAIVAPLGQHPGDKNQYICFNLSEDPEPLFALSAKELQEELFASRESRPTKKIRGLKTIRANRAPFIAPLSALKDQTNLSEWDKPRCLENWKKIQANPSVFQKAREIFNKPFPSNDDDIEFCLYSGGFLENHDKWQLQVIHKTDPKDLPKLKLSFQKPGLDLLLWRFIGRNYPEVWDEEQRGNWNDFCTARLLSPPANKGRSIADFESELAKILVTEKLDEAQKAALQSLEKYAEKLKQMYPQLQNAIPS